MEAGVPGQGFSPKKFRVMATGSEYLKNAQGGFRSGLWRSFQNFGSRNLDNSAPKIGNFMNPEIPRSLGPSLFLSKKIDFFRF